MARSWGESFPELWVKAVQGLPPEAMKFAINAAVDTLPTNANLCLWGKKASDICCLCREARQSLVHMLNCCQVAMELRRYCQRHDDVLNIIGDFVRSYPPSQYNISVDLTSESYSFPHHITHTNLRPDIVWWCDQQKQLWLFELTISFESITGDAGRWKRAKYQDLLEAERAVGFKITLITIEVGSRGMLTASDFNILCAAIHAPSKAATDLCLDVIRTTLLGSFKVCTHYYTHYRMSGFTLNPDIL